MDSKGFDDFEILEKENLDEDNLKVKAGEEIEKELHELADNAGKTKNDIGSASKKQEGGLFLKLFGSQLGKSKKENGDNTGDQVDLVGMELGEIAENFDEMLTPVRI